MPEILLAKVEEAINQQICKRILRIPVKATNEATKTAADLAYHSRTSVHVIFNITLWLIHRHNDLRY